MGRFGFLERHVCEEAVLDNNLEVLACGHTHHMECREWEWVGRPHWCLVIDDPVPDVEWPTFLESEVPYVGTDVLDPYCSPVQPPMGTGDVGSAKLPPVQSVDDVESAVGCPRSGSSVLTPTDELNVHERYDRCRTECES